MENLDFGFVDNDDVRRVLEEYFRQTRASFDAESHLGAIVGCGAVVEGLLTWALLQRPEELSAYIGERPILWRARSQSSTKNWLKDLLILF